MTTVLHDETKELEADLSVRTTLTMRGAREDVTTAAIGTTLEENRTVTAREPTATLI